MSESEHVVEFLPAYALGSLEPEDIQRVEEHLHGCLLCREESSAFQNAADQLSLAAPMASPSSDLKDRLMQRVHQVSPARAKGQERLSRLAPSRPFWERLFPAWGLASLVLIVALAASTFLLWQRMEQLEFRTPGGMHAVPLSPPKEGSEATGFVLISADGDDGALVVDGLPPLGDDQQYQLWLIRDGQRTSGAVFSTDEKSYGGTRIRAPRPLTDYSAVGITIEPAGGSPQPTGEQVLAGPLINP